MIFNLKINFTARGKKTDSKSVVQDLKKSILSDPNLMKFLLSMMLDKLIWPQVGVLSLNNGKTVFVVVVVDLEHTLMKKIKR